MREHIQQILAAMRAEEVAKGLGLSKCIHSAGYTGAASPAHHFGPLLPYEILQSFLQGRTWAHMVSTLVEKSKKAFKSITHLQTQYRGLILIRKAREIAFIKAWNKALKHLSAKSVRLNDKSLVDLVNKLRKVKIETKRSIAQKYIARCYFIYRIAFLNWRLDNRSRMCRQAMILDNIQACQDKLADFYRFQ